MTRRLPATLLLAIFSIVQAYGQDSGAPGIPLHLAALQGNDDAVRAHVEAGTDLDQKDAFGSTPLMIAATFGRVPVAEALVEGGADLGVTNDDGGTALHTAAFLGRSEIVQVLLDGGADRYHRDRFGNTALDAVAGPFDYVRSIYEDIRQALAPLGLELDLEEIREQRPVIVALLRPTAEEMDEISYAPVVRDDWPVSTPADEGLDPNLVAELFGDAAEMETLYALLVLKNGRLVAEGYFNEGAIDRTNRLQSVTKSVTSALVGIALQQGCLERLDQRMMDFFPEVADDVTDPRKREITIEQMLQMRGGYPWEETDPVLWEGLLSGTYVPLIESFPLAADPGTTFQYSNLTSNWLGIILDRACDARLRAYAVEHLFTPIGVEAGEWGTDADGHNNGCADLFLTARDAARFGLLYMNDGVWQGSQVIPIEWVEASHGRYSDTVDSAGLEDSRLGSYLRDVSYGYQWWSARIGAHDVTLAWGHGGQFIVLLEDLDMIIVTASKPFYVEHNDEAWRHERSIVNLIGKFVQFLPSE